MFLGVTCASGVDAALLLLSSMTMTVITERLSIDVVLVLLVVVNCMIT